MWEHQTKYQCGPYCKSYWQQHSHWLLERMNGICCIKSTSVVALLSHSGRVLAAKSSIWCLAEFSVFLHITTPAGSSWRINEAGQQWHQGFEEQCWLVKKQHMQLTGDEYSARLYRWNSHRSLGTVSFNQYHSRTLFSSTRDGRQNTRHTT